MRIHAAISYSSIRVNRCNQSVCLCKVKSLQKKQMKLAHGMVTSEGTHKEVKDLKFMH